MNCLVYDERTHVLNNLGGLTVQALSVYFYVLKVAGDNRVNKIIECVRGRVRDARIFIFLLCDDSD